MNKYISNMKKPRLLILVVVLILVLGSIGSLIHYKYFYKLPGTWITSNDSNISTSINSSSNVQSNTGVSVFSNGSVQYHATDVASMNFSWYRQDLGWAKIETTKGVYDFSFYDQLDKSINQQGLKPLYILAYGNPLYSGSADRFYVPTDPAQFKIFMQAFGAFAYQAAEHFKGSGARFEIWNEPYENEFWHPLPNASEYAQLDNYATQQINSADPSVLVTTASILGGVKDIDFFNQFLADGGGKYNNAVALHPYRQTYPETVISDFATESATVHKYLPNVQIWDTEWGYPSDPRWYSLKINPKKEDPLTLQAKYSARQLLSAWMAGFNFSIYFSDAEVPTSPGVKYPFGLYGLTWNVKPAEIAVKTLLTNVRGMDYVGRITTSNPDLYIAEFKDQNKKLLICWTDNQNSNQTMTFETKPSSVSDYLGQNISNQSSLNISDSPVYLEFNGASKQIVFDLKK